MILYLHGFRSSPQSFKARMLRERMQALGLGEQFLCPQLPASPREAMALADALARSVAPGALHLVGSSLGGFYATALAERFGCRAVLVNPAVTPARDLERYVGECRTWHGDEPFEFKPEYVGELERLEVARITRPERYLLLAATGDEVLDWRQMAGHYADANQHVIEGGDHGLSDFDKYVDEVLNFCNVKQ